MIRELIALVDASANLLVAKIRGVTDPCPPHDFTHDWVFCEKCGKWKTDIPDAEL